MARNLETKARYADLAYAAAAVRGAGAAPAGVLWQTDTYFEVPRGRIKLRQFRLERAGQPSESGAELILYQRPDLPGTRTSSYEILRVDPDRAEPCRASLAAILGIRVIVRKRRELWLVGATRVHLDDVESLGRFVELETVLGTRPEPEAAAEHARLLALLGITAADAIAGSYADLMRAAAAVAPVATPS